jgi:hypothetical protein
MRKNYFRSKYPYGHPQRLWERVDKTGGPNSCWPWMGFRKYSGYGQVAFYSSEYSLTHRVAYELTTGEQIEDGLIILHTCDNPPCCNPRHLRKGTKKDNTHDMVNPKAKLTRDEVLEIKRLLRDGMSQKKIARIFGVNGGTISCIDSGRNWGWLKEKETES